jgi:hypothetical protein
MLLTLVIEVIGMDIKVDKFESFIRIFIVVLFSLFAVFCLSALLAVLTIEIKNNWGLTCS